MKNLQKQYEGEGEGVYFMVFVDVLCFLGLEQSEC